MIPNDCPVFQGWKHHAEYSRSFPVSSPTLMNMTIAGHVNVWALLLDSWWTMTYDELWSSDRVPFRIHRRTARRLWWKECGPGAWDSEQWLSPHRITSTYRHIDMACLKPQSTKWKKICCSKMLRQYTKGTVVRCMYIFWICFVRLFYCRRFPEMLCFFRLLKQLIFYITSFLCQELSYMIYDVISFQTCSSSETFTFDVMKSFQICPFKEPSYLMRFLFSNFPFQELSHLMWSLFRFIPFQERSYLMWFLFRNCPFQELSHFMYFFSDLFCFRKNRIWHDFLFLSRGLSSFWAGFLSNDLISKKQGPFQFQTWGGNYVVDIVHVRYIYILLYRYVFFVHSIFPILHI